MYKAALNNWKQNYKDYLTLIKNSVSQLNQSRRNSLLVSIIAWIPSGRQISKKLREKCQENKIDLQIQINEFLIFRDQLQKELDQALQLLIPEQWLQLLELDEQLKSSAESDGWADCVDSIRESLNPDVRESHWWWFSKHLAPPQGMRLRGWLKFFTRTIWIFALVVLSYFSSKVIAGNPDTFGILTLTLNAILGLLIANGILFGTGMIGLLEKLMIQRRIAPNIQKFLQVLIASSVAIVAISTHSMMPAISNYYYDRAELAYKNHEFCPSIQQCLSKRNTINNPIYSQLITKFPSRDPYTDYYRAIQFDPNNLDAQNRLGEIHEDRGENEQALSYYQTAAQTKSITSIAALTNISRYFILKGEASKNIASYNYAITFINNASDVIDSTALSQYEFGNLLNTNERSQPFEAICKTVFKERNNNSPHQKLRNQLMQKCAWFELNRYNYRVYAAWAHFRLYEAMDSSSMNSQQVGNNSFHFEKAKNFLSFAIQPSISFRDYLQEESSSQFVVDHSANENSQHSRIRSIAQCLLLMYPKNLYEEVSTKVQTQILKKNTDLWIRQLIQSDDFLMDQKVWQDRQKRDIRECRDSLINAGRLRSYEAAWIFNVERIDRESR